MKTKTIQLSALLIIILLSITDISFAQGKTIIPKRKTIQLFNGKNLSNWVFKLRNPAADPDTVFTVKDGVIHITGRPFGYMRTKAIYSDYKLHVEWRWPSVATNSGVFIHATQPDTIWIRTVECQLQAGNAGDLVCMNGSDMNEHIDKKNMVVKKSGASSEKPTGEWNTMEVICKGNTINIYRFLYQ